MSEHSEAVTTPGPWTLSEPWDTPNGGYTVMGPDGAYIADVYAGHHPDDIAGPVTGQANAHLIAAAPLMRDALRELLEGMTYTMGGIERCAHCYLVVTDCKCRYGRARAALSASEGRTPTEGGSDGK